MPHLSYVISVYSVSNARQRHGNDAVADVGQVQVNLQGTFVVSAPVLRDCCLDVPLEAPAYLEAVCNKSGCPKKVDEEVEAVNHVVIHDHFKAQGH